MWQGMAGCEMMELRTAVRGNHYCFHLYCTSGSGLLSRASQLPICIDEETGCLIQAEAEPGREPAVFSLQTASLAQMLQERLSLRQQCEEQRDCFQRLDQSLRQRKDACKSTAAEQSPELAKLQNERNDAEEKLVYLEDMLEFVKDQHQFKLQAAGAGASHGLPPEACTPDSKDSLRESCGIEASRSCTIKADSDVEKLQKERLRRNQKERLEIFKRLAIESGACIPDIPRSSCSLYSKC